MSKKSGSKGKKALWLLVAVALVCIVLTPLNKHVPRLHWRAPVHVAMPPMTKITNALPDLPDMPKSLPDMPSIPKIGLPDVGKLESKIQGKVEDILSEIPPFPYEVAPRKPSAETPQAEDVPPVPQHPPTPPTQGKGARIALIIDDMGLVPTLSERAVRLPRKITLAYLPYAPRLQQQTEAAAAAGHDLMLHLPMEPLGGENPGPHALFTAQSEAEWTSSLDRALKSFEGYIGVNNHMGSKFTVDAKAMAFVAQVLHEKGVFFIDSKTNAKSIAGKVAHEAGLKTGSRDVFLDDTQTASAIRAELAHAERVARQNGQAIAIGHPHAVTLDELERWLPDAQTRGYEIVPVRSVVK